MKIIRLNRTVRAPSFAQGMITYCGAPVCFTLERPWLGNKRNVSCIPPGMYECVRESHEKLGQVLRVNGVPKRAGILVHAANYVDQLQGCIAPGDFFDIMDFKLAIISSRKALNRLLELVDSHGKLTLDVIDYEEIS